MFSGGENHSILPSERIASLYIFMRAPFDVVIKDSEVTIQYSEYGLLHTFFAVDFRAGSYSLNVGRPSENRCPSVSL